MRSLEQTSAKIYQFPVGGRGGIARREQATTETVSHAVVTSSSWYHEAAMLDEQPRKPQ
ncbi:DUF2735 domain-containing protein [Rhodopseudomonas palustris]|uniref:DUF2735 domain-containing protein n=1 Tax=Rhodopseudomonas TaxID=1073 RepID=UPI0006B9EE7C|nr:DUF2735 domain-containing protein [Rhodopseudomonas sp. AAP120]KPF95216.1 glutamine synthetase [Rhodopseudomonas sp. AAP120]MCP9627299.1 DUF2735 domain-containing protein [Rhodopseudomonas palustris]